MSRQHLLILLITILALSSCKSSSKYSTSSNADWGYAEKSQRYEAKEREAGLYQINDDDKKPEEPTGEQEVERKLIYNASLSIEVDSTTTAKQQALNIMKSYKGYMLNSTKTSLTIRIPASDLSAALNDFKKLGKVTSENMQGEDVTDRYYDTQMRLENAEKTRKRYLELLDQAKSVSEIIKVEKELERINEKVERLKAQMKNYDQNIDFSRVSIYFQAKEDKVRPGPLGYIFVGLYKGIKWLFVWD